MTYPPPLLVAGLLSLRWSTTLPAITAFTFGPPCVASLDFARAAGELVDVSGGAGADIDGAGGGASVRTTPTASTVGGGVSSCGASPSPSAGSADTTGSDDDSSIPHDPPRLSLLLLPRVVSVINGRDLVARLSLSNAGQFALSTLQRTLSIHSLLLHSFPAHL